MMKRSSSWIWICVVGYLFIACGGKKSNPTSSSDSDGGLVRGPVTPSIKGTVRDTSGQSLAGAVVEARALGGASLIHADSTNAQGSYRLVLQGFTLGRDVEVQARLPGYRDTTRTVKLESSETVGIIFDLEPVIKTAIVGKVTDPSGRPVSQAVVETDPATTSTKTSDDGTFRIEVELNESAVYTVRVYQGSVLLKISQVTVNPKQETRVSVEVQPVGTIQFLGSARDVLAGGIGLSNTSVSLRDSSGTHLDKDVSGSDGGYSLSREAVFGETFILQAEHVGFRSSLDTVIVQGDTVLNDFSLSLVISGTVQDPRGQPVSNAVVNTANHSGAGDVKHDGQFEFIPNKNLAGDTLIVSADGFQEARQWVEYSRKADNRVPFQLQPLVDPQPQVNPQTLNFSVLTERDSLLINGASEASDLAWTVTDIPDWLVAEPASDTVRAFESGRNLVVRVLRENLPLGSNGEVVGSLRLAFNSSAVPTFDVSVSVFKQSLTGRVYLNNIPVFGGTVSIRASLTSSEVLALGKTNDEGRYALGVVPTGNYTMMVEAEGTLTSLFSVFLTEGEIGVIKDVSLIPLPRSAEMVYESGVPFKILPDPSDGDRAYVLVRTSPPDNTIKIVSGLMSGRGQTSRVGSDIVVGQSPTDAEFFNQNLVVACYSDDSIWIIDLNTQLTTRIKTSPGPFGLDVEDNQAYVACEGENGQSVLDIVDLEAREVTGTVALGELVTSLGDEPWGPDVAVSGTHAYVTNNQESGKILVVDLSASPSAVTGSINTGGRPQQVVMDEMAGRLYVLDKRNPAGVTVIDVFSNSRLEAIEIEDRQDFPRALALIPEMIVPSIPVGNRETLTTTTEPSRKILLVGFNQDLVFYDLDLGVVSGQITTTEDSNARIVSVNLSSDGRGILVGLERAQLGKRLMFFQF